MSVRAASWSALLSLSIVGVIAFTVPSFGQQSGSAPAAKTQWNRVYSVAQARRGEALFADTCVPCHASDRAASRTNLPLNSQTFWYNWSGLSLDLLSQRIRLTMPATAPGTLTPGQTADIIAFLFELEGAQAGSADLPSTPAELRSIRFVEPVPPALAR